MAKLAFLLAILLVGVGVVLGAEMIQSAKDEKGKSADAHSAGGPLVNVDSQRVRQVVVLSRQGPKGAGASADAATMAAAAAASDA